MRKFLLAAAFTALMGDARAAMVFTDPPYNVPIDGHASGLGAIHHRPFPMASGEMDRTEFTAFLGQAIRNLAAFSIDGSLHYLAAVLNGTLKPEGDLTALDTNVIVMQILDAARESARTGKTIKLAPLPQ